MNVSRLTYDMLKAERTVQLYRLKIRFLLTMGLCHQVLRHTGRHRQENRMCLVRLELEASVAAAPRKSPQLPGNDKLEKSELKARHQ